MAYEDGRARSLHMPLLYQTYFLRQYRKKYADDSIDSIALQEAYLNRTIKTFWCITRKSVRYCVKTRSHIFMGD